MSDETTRVILELQGKDSGATATVSGIASSVGKLAAQALISAGAVDAMRRALEFSIQSAAEAERVDAQLTAALSSTAGAAGMTKNELESLATELSRVSTYDDEAIKSTEALLLTFTQVGKNVFPEATQAILDMSTAMGQDLKTSTIQIGKALNDPIKGITALRRAGVSFTEDQEKLIASLVESGNTMEAQKIILDELSREFGGSAAAAVDTYEGQIKQLKNEIGNLAEAYGEDLLPAISKTAGGLTDYLRIQQDVNELMESGENTYRRAALAQATIAEVTERATARSREADSARWEGIASIHEQTKAMEDLILSEEEQQKIIEDYQKYNASIIDDAIQITENTEKYNEQQQKVLDAIAKTRAEGEKLYPWEHEKIKENQQALEELGQQYFQNRDDFIAASEERIAMMAVEKIAMMDGIKGYSDSEFELAKSILERSDIATAAAFDQQQAMELLSSAVAAGQINVEQFGAIMDSVMADGVTSVSEVKAAIEGLPSEKTIMLNIATNYSEATQAALQLYSSGEKSYGGGRATGGGVSAGKSYLVGERGPEILTMGGSGYVTPNSQLGGSTIVNIMLDSATPDPERVAYNLKPAVERVIREMQQAGRV